MPRPNLTPIDPDEHIRVIGKTFARHERLPLLVIGNRVWNRWDLGRMGCPHPVAAATLNRVIDQLKIRTLEELADRAQEIGTYKGCGITAYWTVLAILRSAGYKVNDIHHVDVTYDTVKKRAIREQQKDSPTRKRRSRHNKG
jgi:hypothetical protein